MYKTIFIYLIILTVTIAMVECSKQVQYTEDQPTQDQTTQDQLIQDQINGYMIIDHKCINISQIPDEWIENVKDNIKVFYAHTSHGEQLSRRSDLNCGVKFLRDDVNSKYAYTAAQGELPKVIDSLCIWDNRDYGGQPWDYWDEDGPQNTINIIDSDNEINVSFFCWCTQMDSYSSEKVQDYLDQMAAFEEMYTESGEKNRKVFFVYFTGNADWNSSRGYTRYHNNEQIRNWVRDNPEKNRILYDFADIECWLYDENGEAIEGSFSTYEYNGETIPVRCTEYSVEEYSHTTRENCINKAKALWWMLARIAGWGGQ